MDSSFSGEEKICKKKDFEEAYKKGGKSVNRNFILIVHPNMVGKRRLGMTVGKKVGKAVKRNRIKRIVREYFRLNKELFLPSSDIVFIAKHQTRNLTYQTLSQGMKTILYPVIIDKETI